MILVVANRKFTINPNEDDIDRGIAAGFISSKASFQAQLVVAAYMEILAGRFAHLRQNESNPWGLYYNGQRVAANAAGDDLPMEIDYLQ